MRIPHGGAGSGIGDRFKALAPPSSQCRMRTISRCRLGGSATMRWSWTFLIGLVAAVLYAIKIPAPDQETRWPNIAMYSGRLLTFSIPDAKDFNSGDAKVATVKVWVSGGSTADWVATAIAIAEHIGAS